MLVVIFVSLLIMHDDVFRLLFLMGGLFAALWILWMWLFSQRGRGRGRGQGREAMTNSLATPTDTDTGIAGNASSFAAAIQAKCVQLQDELLISKYRTDYEHAIVQLDDFLGLLMVKTAMTLRPTSAESVQDLIRLQQAKDALNSAMKALDKIMDE